MRQNLSVAIVDEKLKERYNHFVLKHPLGSIHQLWEWGVFQSKSAMRDKFWALAVLDKEEIIASTLVIKQRLPFGKCWLYCPRGPLMSYENLFGDDLSNRNSKNEAEAAFKKDSTKAFELLLLKIARIANEENAVFLRIDPGLDETQQCDFSRFGFRKAHAHYQPENTLIVDLTQSEEQILAQMKPKGRYNVKVALKHGVIIRVSNDEIINKNATKDKAIDQTVTQATSFNQKDLEAFYNLFQQTTARDGFAGHPLSYYQNMLNILGNDHVKLYTAEYKDEIIAGMIVTWFKDTAIYYFGASGNQHRNVMAPYLLQWQAMKYAKERGMKFYDFLGIAPEGSIGHAWAGVTDFKLKFGGKKVNYYPAQELIYKPLWYFLMLVRKKLKR